MEKLETDELIYSRFLAERNEKDLRTLLERHGENLTLFIYSHVHNMEDAEELMMDAFAAAAAGRSVFAGRSSFKTWLFSIGHNLALMHLRKKKIKTVPLDDLAENSFYSQEQSGVMELSPLEEERNARLYSALEEINSEYRHVLHLLYIEQMSVEEVCKVLRKNRKQIYNLAERGRRALRERIGGTDTDLL